MFTNAIHYHKSFSKLCPIVCCANPHGELIWHVSLATQKIYKLKVGQIASLSPFPSSPHLNFRLTFWLCKGRVWGCLETQTLKPQKEQLGKKKKNNYKFWSRGGGLVAKSCLTLATPWIVAYQAPLSRVAPVFPPGTFKA